ncbi:MAG: hypothetical protein PUE38_02795 [Olsenella sp.]|nr:hypothetical protein [Olsenella sp.]
MSKARRSPAIFAGLVGGALLVLPETAQAQTLTLTIDDLLVSPWAYLAAGILAGAAVTGAIAAHVVHKERASAEAELEEVRAAALEARISADEARSILASLGYGTVASSPAPARPAPSPQVEEAPAPAGTPAPVASEPPAALEPLADLAGEKPVGAAGLAPHRAGVSARLDAMLPRLDDPAFERDARPAARTAGASAGVGAASAEDARDAVAAAPEQVRVDGAPAAQAARPQGAPNPNSYAERSQRRARGVRSLLSERIGNNFFMEGLPVIQRADGTVGDVGTAWWENTLSGTITHLGTTSAEDSARIGMRPVDETSELEVDRALADRLATQDVSRRHERAQALAQSLPGFGAPEAREAQPRGKASPTGQAACVPEVGAPAPRQAKADAEGDLFEQALSAMDESLPNMSVRTSDDADALVVPEAAAEMLTGNVLSGSAAPLPGASDGFDAVRHADLIVQEEIERNARERRAGTRRAGLRVIDGGTSDLGEARRQAKRPKHLKTDPKKRMA